MMSGGGDNDDPVSDINVTPFVDVLLVLLIIFMVTAPIVNHSVEVELPKDSYSKDGSPLDKTLRIVVDKAGTIYINNNRIGNNLIGPNRQKFQQTIQDWIKAKPKPWLVDVEADVGVKYGDLLPIITRLKEMEIGMNLIIAPEEAGG